MNDKLATRDALIAVARTLFARHGYAGTSVRAITGEAGANLGAIGYHFGSKEGLYRAVLASVWGPTLEALDVAASADGNPLDRIEAVARVLFANLSARPETASLMLREITQAGPLAPPVARSIHRLFTLIEGLVRAGQADGTIVAGDARLLVLSVLAQPFHLLALRHRMGDVVGLQALDPEVFQALVNNAVGFMRRGLTLPERRL